MLKHMKVKIDIDVVCRLVTLFLLKSMCVDLL